MTRSSPPPPPTGDASARGSSAPGRIPRRSDLEGPTAHWLKRGGRTKADLKVVDVGDGPVVVKDFRHKAAWVRLIGRLQIHRECGAYRWLGPQPGLPRFVGRVDRHALAVECIEGGELAFLPNRSENGPANLVKLRRVVERMHATGLVHLDLRGIDNVLLGTNGEVYVIDLAGAIWLRPGGWLHRLCFGRIVKADRAALLKWKQILDPGSFTAAERSFLKRYRFWRALWVFNRKRHPKA